MQHCAWLREWQRMHGAKTRIKPITKKVDGQKVKVGEANIAVPWSKLPEFFRQGNEYGDIETVKFLSERIKDGKIEPLSRKELLELSEKENVKWSDGKHSLNPFQGYLYDFTDTRNWLLDLPLGGDEYGEFLPISEYKFRYYSKSRDSRIIKDVRNMDYENDDYGPTDELYVDEYNEELFDDFEEEPTSRSKSARKAFRIYYTTRLLQKILKGKEDSKYYDFVDFDITSVTTEEEIRQLDSKLEEMVNSPEIEEELGNLEGNAEFEKEFYEELREEVTIEIKKDSDRIENAYKVYEALETGDFKKLLEDEETTKWAVEVYERELEERQ